MSYTFLKEYTLSAQSPLNHFQHDQEGAMLRATEVKPKLDKYIKKHCKSFNKKWLVSKDKDALKYKMQISVIGKSTKVGIGPHTDYSIYYGNIGKGPHKKGVMANVKLTIICFIPELLAYIDEIMEDFFIVSNFGTMQNKGFGSFLIDGRRPTNERISRLLTEEYGAEKCYCFICNEFSKIATYFDALYFFLKRLSEMFFNDLLV